MNLDRETQLQREIDRLLRSLRKIDPSESTKYKAILEEIQILTKLLEKETPVPPQVEPESKQKREPLKADTLLIVLGNLVGIGMVLFWEHSHPVVSKALGFVLKSKV